MAKQKSAKKWNVYGRFCELLYDAFQPSVPNDAFDGVCLADIPLMKRLYSRFKKDTLASKTFKGFPTNTGHRKSDKGFPVTTIVPKDHPEIVRLFQNFISKNEAELKQLILDEVEKFPNLSDSIIDDGVQDIEENDDDMEEGDDSEEGDEEIHQVEIKQEPEIKQEKSQKRKRSDVSIGSTPPSKEKKLEPQKENQIHPRKLEEVKIIQVKTVEIPKDFLLEVKKSIKAAITRDGEAQSQEMKHCNQELKVLHSHLKVHEPAMNESLVVLEQEKEEIMKRMEEELEKVEQKIKYLKENTFKCLSSLKELVDFLESHISKKGQEFRSLKEKEEEELDEFFKSHI